MARCRAKFEMHQRVAVKQWVNDHNCIARIMDIDEYRVAPTDTAPWYLVKNATHDPTWVREFRLEIPVVDQVIARWRRGEI